jgi:hypothetical protein
MSTADVAPISVIGEQYTCRHAESVDVPCEVVRNGKCVEHDPRSLLSLTILGS